LLHQRPHLPSSEDAAVSKTRMDIVLLCSALVTHAVVLVVFSRQQPPPHPSLEDAAVYKTPMDTVLPCSVRDTLAAELAALLLAQLHLLPSSADAAVSKIPTLTAHRCSAMVTHAVESAVSSQPPHHLQLSADAVVYNSQMHSVPPTTAKDTLVPESPASRQHLLRHPRPLLPVLLPSPLHRPNPSLPPPLLPHPPSQSTPPLIEFTWISA
jgi:hypothetical protein